MKEYKFVISRKPIVIFDCETTGLDPVNDKIIELGAVKILGNSIISEYRGLFNPGFKLPEKITELTHITDEMLESQPTLEKGFIDFLNFIGDDCIVCGHNLSFDYNFVNETCKRLNYKFDFKGICTLLLSEYVFPQEKIEQFKGNNIEDNKQYPKTHKLCDLCDHFNIVLENAHRADADAKATSRVLFALIAKCNKKEQDLSFLFDLLKDKDVILAGKQEREDKYNNSDSSIKMRSFLNSLLQKNNILTTSPIQDIKRKDTSELINFLKQGYPNLLPNIPENIKHLIL